MFMLEIIQSIIIGAVQGITEFLPISSSGHLVLLPYLLNWEYQGLSFDVALHFGTVIAIIVYFWKDWTLIIRQSLRFGTQVLKLEQPKNLESKIQDSINYPKNLLWQILVASIPAAIIGYFISDIVESTLQSPVLLAINLIFFGLLLWFFDKYLKTKRELSNINYKQSFTIGIAQAIALMPGVSRSGITMTAGRAIGLDRPSAARFSFLLGTPAMIGAFLFTIRDFSVNNVNLPFVLAIAVSTLFGFITIKYLLKFLVSNSFSVFAWYRIVLAIFVLAFYYLR